MTSAEFAYN